MSNLGRVKALSKPKDNYNINTKQMCVIIVPEKILTPQLSKWGYYRINLNKNRKNKIYSVHRLVAEAFIHNPTYLPCVNHKDEDKTNNCVDNLEWCTYKYNGNYGTRSKRISEKLGRPIRCVETGVIYKSLTEVCKLHNLNLGNVSSICNHRVGYKTAGGYHWEYVDKDVS